MSNVGLKDMYHFPIFLSTMGRISHVHVSSEKFGRCQPISLERLSRLLVLSRLHCDGRPGIDNVLL